MHYIYKITNNINGKIYIGQTNNPTRRWWQHTSSARRNKGNQLITKAMIKHGLDNFDFSVICTCCTQEDTDETEILLIKQYNSTDMSIGYNLAKGGSKLVSTQEIRKKISVSLREFYKNNDNPNKGRKCSSESRANMSRAAMGKPGTNKGKKFSEEWKQKISKSLTGKIITNEHRENLSKSHMGNIPPNRKLTFEEAEKMREIYKNTNISQKELGRRYGMAQATINSIILYKTYRERE
jgi:group I intron endonuclease